MRNEFMSCHSGFLSEIRNENLTPVVILVNEKSGNGRGSWFLRANSAVARVGRFLVMPFSLSHGEPKAKVGLLRMKQLEEELGEEHLPILCVVCGGDGTLSWVVSEMGAHGVGLDSFVLAIWPFGTGNDFANACRVKVPEFFDPYGAQREAFARVLENFQQMATVKHTVWRVSVRTSADSPNSGNVIFIKEVNGKKVKCREETQGFSKLMLVYSGLGFESRVGLGFDKHRTRSRFGNKFWYVMEFLKKCFKRMDRVSSVIKQIEARDVRGAARWRLAGAPEQQRGAPLTLKSCISMVFLNVNSYAGGAMRLNEVRKPGYMAARTYQGARPNCAPEGLRWGDGKLKIVSLGAKKAIPMELCCARAAPAYVIANEAGEFTVEFDRELEGQNKIYFHVDGEFYCLKNIDDLHFKPEHVINVKIVPEKGAPRG